jgi:hypothetical protein
MRDEWTSQDFQITHERDRDVTFGKPSVYTPELAEEICARLSAGESLKSICRDPGMPPFSTVQGWARTNHCGFTALYDCARELQAQTFADELIDIADDGMNDWVRRENERGGVSYVLNKEHIARSRLRLEARQWVISKILPKKYGDKLQLKHSGVVASSPIISSMDPIEASRAYQRLMNDDDAANS